MSKRRFDNSGCHSVVAKQINAKIPTGVEEYISERPQTVSSERQEQQSFVRKLGEKRPSRGHSVAGENSPHEVRIESAMKQHQRHRSIHSSQSSATTARS